MKYLVLDASEQRAREYGQCLLDSLSDEETNLAASVNSANGYFLTAHESGRMICKRKEVRILIDTLKLCPWMAAKHGVKVVGNKAASRSRGFICNAQFGEFIIKDKDGDEDFYSAKELTLDLTPIERGEVPGVRIEEVEE